MRNFTEYSLRLASKPLKTAALILLLLFLATIFPLLQPPVIDFTFPASITRAAKEIITVQVVAAIAAAIVFAFYRKHAKVCLDETGIQLPGYGFINWQSVHWYRIDHFAAGSGVIRLILKLDNRKAVLLVENGQALAALQEDLKQRLRLHNPLAKDFRELRSSKIRAFLLIGLFVAIHLVISIRTDFEASYMWIFTPVLLVTIFAIVIEHIKMPGSRQG